VSLQVEMASSGTVDGRSPDRFRRMKGVEQ
jgi:hypothetical protein